MRRAGVAEAKNSLSALLAEVKAGKSVVIEERGVPVARLEPLAAAADGEGRLVRLVRSGVAAAPRAKLSVALLGRRPPRPTRRGVSASARLVEERGSGR